MKIAGVLDSVEHCEKSQGKVRELNDLAGWTDICMELWLERSGLA